MDILGLIFLGLVVAAILINVLIILLAAYSWIEKYLP